VAVVPPRRLRAGALDRLSCLVRVSRRGVWLHRLASCWARRHRVDVLVHHSGTPPSLSTGSALSTDCERPLELHVAAAESRVELGLLSEQRLVGSCESAHYDAPRSEESGDSHDVLGQLHGHRRHQAASTSLLASKAEDRTARPLRVVCAALRGFVTLPLRCRRRTRGVPGC
jgi:hypothetical protein